MSLLEWLKTFTHMREIYKKFHGLLLLLVGLLVVPTTLFAQSEGGSGEDAAANDASFS